MPERRRVAVVGAHGYVGRSVCDIVATSASVVPLVRTPRDPSDVAFDFYRDDVVIALDDADVDTVIFAARVHPTSAPDLAALRGAYTEAVERFARACAGRRVVLLSTDAVFDGSRGDYSEEERPAPTTPYGESALVFEDALAHSVADHCIVRLSYVFGLSRCVLDRRLEAARGAAASGRPFPVYEDMFRSPVDVGDAARAIAELAERRVAGVVHVAGARLSTASFFRQALAAIGVGTEHLRAEQLPPGTATQRDTSLRVRRLLEETTVVPRSVEAALAHRCEEEGAIR
jgi:dTDP-4-dehydrorhamnose reductase